MPEFRGKRTTDEKLKRIRNMGRLVSLSLLDTSITDAGVALLAKAENLKEISISSSVLTDACMETLCGLPSLVSLLIHDAPQITDKGIACLKQRDSLRELYLDGTQLTDRGVDSFTHLETIWSLCLKQTRITDDGVSRLAPLCNLRLLSLDETAVVGHGLCDLPTPPDSIYLGGCPVTDDAVQKIAEHLTGLRTLSLKDTPITDACLPALAKLQAIEMLRLTETQVTDKGVACFRGHPSLQALEVRGTTVTEAEAVRLKAATPGEYLRVSVGEAR